MSNRPTITGDEAVSAFERAGFTVDRWAGSHAIMKKAGVRYNLSIPCHKGESLGRGLLRSQIRKAEMSEDEFYALL